MLSFVISKHNQFGTHNQNIYLQVVGALASYLLILVQFKQQEDAMTAMRLNATAMNRSDIE